MSGFGFAVAAPERVGIRVGRSEGTPHRENSLIFGCDFGDAVSFGTLAGPGLSPWLREVVFAARPARIAVTVSGYHVRGFVCCRCTGLGHRALGRARRFDAARDGRHLPFAARRPPAVSPVGLGKGPGSMRGCWSETRYWPTCAGWRAACTVARDRWCCCAGRLRGQDRRDRAVAGPYRTGASGRSASTCS